jgi:hypothetical protein
VLYLRVFGASDVDGGRECEEDFEQNEADDDDEKVFLTGLCANGTRIYFRQACISGTKNGNFDRSVSNDELVFLTGLCANDDEKVFSTGLCKPHKNCICNMSVQTSRKW